MNMLVFDVSCCYREVLRVESRAIFDHTTERQIVRREA